MCKHRKRCLTVGILLVLAICVICYWRSGQRGVFWLLHSGEPDGIEVVIDDKQCEPWYMPGYMVYLMYMRPAEIAFNDPYTATLWILNSYCSTYDNCGTDVEPEMPWISHMPMGEEERQWIRRLNILMLSELAHVAKAQTSVCCDSPYHVAGVSLGSQLLGNENIWDDEMLHSPEVQHQAYLRDFIEQTRQLTDQAFADTPDDHDPGAQLDQMLEPVLYRTLQYAMAAPRNGHSEFFQGIDGLICGFAARCFLWNEYLAEPIYSERIADLLFRYMQGSSDSRLLQSFWAMENGPIDYWARYRPFWNRLLLRLYGLPILMPIRPEQGSLPDIEALVQAWRQVIEQVDSK